MLIVTTVTHKNVRTDRMRQSFERFGYEVADSYNGKGGSEGRRQRDISVVELLERAATGHTHYCYADAADTICQRPFEVPDDHLLYCAEKHLWPKEELMKDYPKYKSLWRYLNGGLVGGPIEIAIEFFKRYRNPQLNSPENGQHLLHLAFLQARKDKFPIKLDTKCETFQCIAHEGINPEFTRGEKGELITNIVTKTTPAIFHGNGGTDMRWIEAQVL